MMIESILHVSIMCRSTEQVNKILRVTVHVTLMMLTLRMFSIFLHDLLVLLGITMISQRIQRRVRCMGAMLKHGIGLPIRLHVSLHTAVIPSRGIDAVVSPSSPTPPLLIVVVLLLAFASFAFAFLLLSFTFTADFLVILVKCITP